jgi:transcriptional regulator with PAS, ATPase and Fis domain
MHTFMAQDRPLLGTDGGMPAVVEFAAKLARTDTTVLITGETGTGKENLAHLIHTRSARAQQPLVTINCAALPEPMIEGELFGYERGAFTGAARAYPGKLSLAQGGTVLLDEIGELPLAAQAKLLRALETREVFRLGAHRPQALDVRIIAATNQDLETHVARRQFRADLYYRINVARVRLPPLRERSADVPTLFAYYIAQMNQRTGASVQAPSAQTMALLMRYAWPGNVRELRNVVEALFVDPPAGPVEPCHLPQVIAAVATSTKDAQPERERILAALLSTHWNCCRAAEQLNWSRMTLYRKMSKHHIARP